jgi:soluble lytic murein transglycosylase-like protein
MNIQKRYRKTWTLPLSTIVLSLVLTMGTPLSGEAELYKYVKNGVVHYANRPPEQIAYTTLKPPPKAIVVESGKQRVIKASSLTKKIPYLDLIYKIAKAYEMNPELVKAVVKVESNYNHRAVSPKGAQGLMQLMPATAKRFGVKDVFDPEDNITGGVKYLRYLFNEFGEHNLDLVLAGYNAGEEAVRKYDNKVPPYNETRQYVKKVKALYLSRSNHRSTKARSIYKYVDKNGVIAFTNIPRVK